MIWVTELDFIARDNLAEMIKTAEADKQQTVSIDFKKTRQMELSGDLLRAMASAGTSHDPILTPKQVQEIKKISEPNFE